MRYEVYIEDFGAAAPLGDSFYHIQFNRYELKFFTSPRQVWPRPLGFWTDNFYAPDSATVVPIWVAAMIFAIWPIVWWWRRIWAADSPLRAPLELSGSEHKRFGIALAFSHLLASYGTYLLWYASSLRLVVLPGNELSPLTGDRIVESPLMGLLTLPSVVGRLFQRGASLRERILLIAYESSYLLIFGAVFWIIYWRTLQQRIRRRDGLCLVCGYDLRASPNLCPECGHVIHSSDASLQ